MSVIKSPAFPRQGCRYHALGATMMALPQVAIWRKRSEIDRSAGMEVQDYRDALAQRLPDVKDKRLMKPASGTCPHGDAE